MTRYLLRRALYAVPLLFGINLLLFLLFFVVYRPDDMARMQLGLKRVTPEAVEKWKYERGYHLPVFWNTTAHGVDHVTQTIFATKSLSLFALRFGHSDGGRDIGADIRQRAGPSLVLAVPSLLVGLGVHITLALGAVMLRGSRWEAGAMAGCVALMSISSLFFIIAGQFLVSKLMRLVPISGYADGWAAVKFLALPVTISVVSGLGAAVRWYRTLFLEEVEKDYVRTARAKGLDETTVMFRHVLPNALLPILTGVVVVLPLLFTGSLIMESFFGIPGLGSYTIEAINNQDFAIVRAMVFLGSALYILGLVLTDIAYTLADPRVQLN